MRAHYSLPDDFLLYVGTIEPRKNLTRLLHAWEPLYRAGEAPPLVIVGRRGWLSDDFYAALEASPARDAVIFTGYVADADLPALYAAATAFVFPSLYEGFGLPPLEALAVGTPVICSNTSSLPEVVGDAALTFDPTAEEEIAAALQHITGDAELRADLRERGLRRAAQFSWERAAREPLAVYLNLLPGHPAHAKRARLNAGRVEIYVTLACRLLYTHCGCKGAYSGRRVNDSALLFLCFPRFETDNQIHSQSVPHFA